jgi:hypothetical protein
MKSRQMLEALQQRLRERNISSFFPADDHVFLGVYAGGESVDVQVADPDKGRESFAWKDANGEPHTESPDDTLAWLASWAAAAEPSKVTDSTRAD